MRAAKKRHERRAGGWTIALAGLVIFGGAALLQFGSGTPPSSRQMVGGSIDLVDGHGHHVRETDLRGRLTLIYFGYTDCPDICPTTLGEIAIAMDRLGAVANRVQPVFITVDPEHETPAAMARYTAAISPRLMGLTGSAEAIAEAERAYHVHVVRAGNGFDHSSVIYVIGPDGKLLAPIPADSPGRKIAAEILRFLS